MITVEHLTKRYGDFLAVDDLSFTIGEGHVYGFLGPNGAGKSTTMNIMTGCLSATSGSVKIDGFDIFEQANQAKQRIGYLPEQPPLYMNETPAEYLQFVGEAKGLRGTDLFQQIGSVMEKTKIYEVRNRRIATLSKGYKQRVGIAQALLGNPPVIILDEPTVGLDPLQIIEIRELITQLGEEHTVILSSHILSEIQAICEKILIISKGKLIAFDAPENLEKALIGSNEVVFVTEASVEVMREVIDSLDLGEVEVQAEEKQAGYITVHLKIAQEDVYGVTRKLFFAFARKGVALMEMTAKKASLEEIFIELTEDESTGSLSEPVESAPSSETEEGGNTRDSGTEA